MASKRVKRNTGALVEVTFYADEAATDADGNVTYAVTEADGSALSGGTGTAAHVGAAGSGRYSFTLAPQANLNILTATFTGTFGGLVQSQTVAIEIVGGFYVALAELRAQPNLDNTTKYTTAELVAARRWFEDLAERYCGVAFVPRFKRVRLDGSGRADLDLGVPLVRSVLSVRDYSDATTYTEFSVDDLAGLVPSVLGARQASGAAWTYGNRNLVVELEHGYDEPPADVHDAALIAIRSKLLNDQTGRPMLSVADGAGGTTRFAFPGPDRPTGIPDVDEVLNAHRFLAVG